MAPHSPGTDQIDTLLWIGFIAAAILVVGFNAALFAVVRRGRRQTGAAQAATAAPERGGAAGGRRLQLRVGGALGAFAAVLVVLGIVFTDKAREAPASGPAGMQAAHGGPLRIAATGQQWLWRYDYPNGSFSYYKLVVPVDTAVELDLVSTDVVHTWNVPSLAGKKDAVPGKVSHVFFRADREGSFGGDAATLSGQAYASMRTEVEVVSPQAYEDFLAQQRNDIDAAQDRVVSLIENGEVP